MDDLWWARGSARQSGGPPSGAGAPVQHYGSVDLARDDMKNPLERPVGRGFKSPRAHHTLSGGERAPNLFHYIFKTILRIPNCRITYVRVRIGTTTLNWCGRS